jgi:hypothetical protein
METNDKVFLEGLHRKIGFQRRIASYCGECQHSTTDAKGLLECHYYGALIAFPVLKISTCLNGVKRAKILMSGERLPTETPGAQGAETPLCEPPPFDDEETDQ